MRDLLDLYCLAHDYEVRDLMWRCEEEIVLKVSSQNVVCILVAYYQRLTKQMAFQEDPTIQSRNLPQSPIGESSSSSKEEVKELASQPSQLLQPGSLLLIE